MKHVIRTLLERASLRRSGWKLLKSTAINAARYDRRGQILWIRFGHDGRPYGYDAPASTYHGLRGAESPGRYFHTEIRNRWPYYRPTDPTERVGTTTSRRAS
jgi:KTSC domain